jgi:PAS domain S-box-containing protein
MELGPARHILDAIADAVSIRGLDGRIVYANRAALDLYGMGSVEEMGARDPRSLMEPWELSDEQGRPVGIDALPSVQLLRGEQPEPLVLRALERRTGRERWVVLKASALRDEQGRIAGAVTISEDVTDTKRLGLRMQFLARAGQLLASSLDYEQTLRNVASLAVPEIADWCTVDLFEGSRRVPVAVAHSDPAKLDLAERLHKLEPPELDPERGLGRVMHRGEAVLYREVPDELLVEGALDREHLLVLREIGFRSVALAPMSARGETIGALTLVTSDSGRELGDDDLDLARQLAERAALAVENARLYGDRAEIARTLQRSLLPARLPHIPGWEIATLYRAAGEGNEVGGDFYDFWQSDGDWLMMIGDVAGKGIAAAALTSLVRHTARATAEFDPAPGTILSHVDRALKRNAGAAVCTALCMRLAGGRTTVVCGGHPLPLLLGPEGVREVGEHGTLLGTLRTISLPEHSFAMQPGTTLVAVTDGVTDTVGREGERFGTERLVRVLHEARRESPPAIRTRIARALDSFQVGPQADDTAIAVMRYTGAPMRELSPGLARAEAAALAPSALAV